MIRKITHKETQMYLERKKKMIRKQMPWWEKKEQNKTKPFRRVNGCQFLKSEFYRVIKMMSVFPNSLVAKKMGYFIKQKGNLSCVRYRH